MYTYQCLACQSYTEIADCLNLAFSDYALPVQLNAEQVEAFFASSGADLRLSYGAFYDNRLIGFMVNACSVYNGEQAVFDVATGVVPEHRGKKVFTNLFSFAERELRKQGVEKTIWRFSSKIRRQSMPTKSKGLQSVGHFLS